MDISHFLPRSSICRSLLLGLILLSGLGFVPGRANAQWPPFRFRLEPSFEDNRITYHIEFSSQVEWAMTDVIFRFPLPDGTRYLESGAQPTTRIDFDGKEVTFFTATFNQKSIKDAFFIVEVLDPAITSYTTHAWISWKGDQPGDYLTENVSIDITKQPLTWQKPKSRLQLEAIANVSDDAIIYVLYPTNVGKERMWDLRINLPVPTGTTFLSADAPAPFVASFDGQEISFSIIELERGAEATPLSLKVSTEGVITSSLVTHAWATWKNGGRRLKQDVLAQEDYRTADLVAQPHTPQQVISDAVGDVPFSNYDLSAVVLQDDGQDLKVDFFTVSELGPVGEPLEYIFYIDRDCQANTGLARRNLGVEHRVRYRHNRGKADNYIWEELEKKWRRSPIEVNSSASGNVVNMWLPGDLLETSKSFCWMAEAKHRTEAFSTSLPTERVPSADEPKVARYSMGELRPYDKVPQ